LANIQHRTANKEPSAKATPRQIIGLDHQLAVFHGRRGLDGSGYVLQRGQATGHDLRRAGLAQIARRAANRPATWRRLLHTGFTR
jgi:hypothetical protein